jgi:hypothetical protein
MPVNPGLEECSFEAIFVKGKSPDYRRYFIAEVSVVVRELEQCSIRQQILGNQ